MSAFADFVIEANCAKVNGSEHFHPCCYTIFITLLAFGVAMFHLQTFLPT